MSQPRDKYDYPGLPLRDRDGNPVGVGDRLCTPDGGAFPVIRVTEFEGAIGYTLPRINKVMPLSVMHPDALKSWSLVMPPGFPKDRRCFRHGYTFRFVDDWHGYHLDGAQKGRARRTGKPCSDAACWEFDGDGNSLQPKATVKESLTVEDAPAPTDLARLRAEVELMRVEVDGLLRWQGTQIKTVNPDDATLDTTESDQLRERVESLESAVNQLGDEIYDDPSAAPIKDRVELLEHGGESLSGQIRALTRRLDALAPKFANPGGDVLPHPVPGVNQTMTTDPLPTDPADWEPCEWDGKTFPVWMKYGGEVWQFNDEDWSVCIAGRVGLANRWLDAGASNSRWTPVRPKRRQTEPDPLSDEALRDWWWKNRERISVIHFIGSAQATWHHTADDKQKFVEAGYSVQEALRSLRQQVMEREKGGAE